jgi:hypothetical protein
MRRKVDEVKDMIDLTPFKQRFAGNDKDLGIEFDRAVADIIGLVLREASLR